MTRASTRLLAGCGTAADDRSGAQRAEGGAEPITPRSLAAVVAEDVGEPSRAGPAADLEELGDGLGAGVDFRYADEGDGSYLLSVGVGRDFEEVAGGCAGWSGVSGPQNTGDPRRLDLPVSVQDMLEIAADPRIDVTTSRAAVEAGRDLAYWSDSPT